MIQITQPNCCVLLLTWHQAFDHLHFLGIVILYQFLLRVFFLSCFACFPLCCLSSTSIVSSHGKLVQVIDPTEKLHKLFLGFEEKVLTRLNWICFLIKFILCGHPQGDAGIACKSYRRGDERPFRKEPLPQSEAADGNGSAAECLTIASPEALHAAAPPWM